MTSCCLTSPAVMGPCCACRTSRRARLRLGGVDLVDSVGDDGDFDLLRGDFLEALTCEVVLQTGAAECGTLESSLLSPTCANC